MRPKRLYEHSRRVEAQSHDWKQRYYAETGSLRGRIAQLETVLSKHRAVEELCHHLRHCRECGETDVMNCFEGKQLWEAAGMPADGAPVNGRESQS